MLRMQPVETREKTEGPRCETDADSEPIGFFFPLIPHGIIPSIPSDFLSGKLGHFTWNTDDIPNTVGMELSSLHCGNRQTLLGKNRMYNLFFFILLLLCLLHVAAENVFPSCAVFKPTQNHIILMSSSGFLCTFYANSCILCRARIFHLHLVIPINQMVFCYLLWIVTTLTIRKRRCNISLPVTELVCVMVAAAASSELNHRSVATG